MKSFFSVVSFALCLYFLLYSGFVFQFLHNQIMYSTVDYFHRSKSVNTWQPFCFLSFFFILRTFKFDGQYFFFGHTEFYKTLSHSLNGFFRRLFLFLLSLLVIVGFDITFVIALLFDQASIVIVYSCPSFYTRFFFSLSLYLFLCLLQINLKTHSKSKCNKAFPLVRTRDTTKNVYAPV